MEGVLLRGHIAENKFNNRFEIKTQCREYYEKGHIS